MKNTIAGTCALVLTYSAAIVAAPVSESRVWTETYPVDTVTPHLAISNIWGNVRVRPGSSGEIRVTVDERRSAPDWERFERSLETLKLDVEADTNGVSILVGTRSKNWGHRNSTWLLLMRPITARAK